MSIVDINQLELKNERALGRSQGLVVAMEICLDVVKEMVITDRHAAIVVQTIANRISARATVATAEARALHTELGRAIGVLA